MKPTQNQPAAPPAPVPAAPKQPAPELQSMPIRAYLDQTVVPILLDGTYWYNVV